MEERDRELRKLGWDDWFGQRIELGPSHTVARVAAVDRRQLLLMDEEGPFRAKLAGSYLYRHKSSHEQPCVGDWVCVEKQPGGSVAVIHSILPRRTTLRRKKAGSSIDYQMIAGNVDHVVIVQSCQFDFNVKRLERYLVMVGEGGAEPTVLLTKTDLVEPAELEERISVIRAAGITVPIMALSNVTREGLDVFRQLLLPGATYCFVGSSGVGKSTLINHLTGSKLQETGSVSGTGEGRHTTVRRELVLLDGGALVIDNPGMREFGILGAEEGISGSFSDIAQLASQCRFRDCTHTREPGCAVRKAVKSGDISEDHYDNFTKLRKESEFNEMSYVERRRKYRDFGRYIKSAKKDLGYE